MDAFDESVRDNTNKFVDLECHLAWLNDVAKGSRAKVDWIVIGVEGRWVEVMNPVWKRLVTVNVYTDSVASWIVVRHRESESEKGDREKVRRKI